MSRTPSRRRSGRRLPALAATGVAVLVLSGCGEGPLLAGAAAVVGDERIAAERFENVVERGLANPQAAQQLGAEPVAFQRQVLSRLITGELLQQIARERGISVTEGEVDDRFAELAERLGGPEQLEAQAAASGIAPQDLRPFLRDLILNDKIADALVEDVEVPREQLQALYQQNIAQFDQVRARHILLRTQAEAQQVLQQVRADPSRFPEIARERSLDEGSGAQGGELPPVGRGAYVAEFEDALFAARPGQFGVVQTQFGFHVYQLLERRTTPLAEAIPQLRRQALQDQRGAALAELLRERSLEEGVRVNPRYGRWDPQQIAVVERDYPLSTPGGELLDGPVLPDVGVPQTGEQPQVPAPSS